MNTVTEALMWERAVAGGIYLFIYCFVILTSLQSHDSLQDFFFFALGTLPSSEQQKPAFDFLFFF